MSNLKFVTLFPFFGVPVRMHWSLSLILVLGLLGSTRDISILVGAASFWGILVVHEFGHMFVAQRLGLDVYSIDLYPFHGLCHFELSSDNYPNYLVSWGGIAAQSLLFIPALLILTFFHKGMPWYLVTPLLFFGPISACIALINLAPARGLDGGICWKALPIFFKRRRGKSKKKGKLKSVK
ncbi:hypothetical protein [Thalassolituus sp. C2-1]|uniref:hypothetical protein n=1 Tax=Venatorbacter sp. C2-1 TaxID=2597518 RepID=UPI001191857A|nr:hypothetical protein [Thalassolituus sp. C2-1]TVV43203.1 hypothetical protein FOT50_12240 [Thalassolituus sp. C2-1]